MVSISGTTRPIPFNWEDFCQNEGTDCVPACFVMAARYWKRLKPELPLPTDPTLWDNFLQRTSAKTSRGTSLWRLKRNMPTAGQIVSKVEADQFEEDVEEEPEPETTELGVIKLANLVLDPRNPKSVNDLKSPLDDVTPPIPQVLVFDKRVMTHRIEGGTHAVILHRIDFDKEKLYVIDPTLYMRKEADVYDFRNFSQGWAACSNLNILVYPEGVKVVTGSERSILSYIRRGAQ